MSRFIFLWGIVSFVILNADDECLYWYYGDEPEKHNPCEDTNGVSYVPDNATPIFIDED